MSTVSFTGINFALNALSEDELSLEYFVTENAPDNLIALPHDAIELEDIPGLESYLAEHGYRVDSAMENCASVCITDKCTKTFPRLEQVVDDITDLLESKGGKVIDLFEDDPEASLVFCDLSNNFADDPTILNE